MLATMKPPGVSKLTSCCDPMNRAVVFLSDLPSFGRMGI